MLKRKDVSWLLGFYIHNFIFAMIAFFSEIGATTFILTSSKDLVKTQ